jgi:hypothetical protein
MTLDSWELAFIRYRLFNHSIEAQNRDNSWCMTLFAFGQVKTEFKLS